MSGRVKRSEPCSNEDCGSRRFRVGDDGYTYCDRGHQQSERGTIVTEDTGELIIHGRTSKRKGDSDAESGVSRVSGFSGPRALEHYLLCLQLVLRKQVKWLIEVQQLPAEVETIVRDLWAFRLQSLRHRTAKDESETDTDGRSNSQSEFFSSQSEGESSDQTRKAKPKPDETRKAPTLLETLALIYAATLFLRIPITIADLHAWAQNGDLLFFRANREVPLQMREKLPAAFQELLEPQELGLPLKLHRVALSLLLEFADTSGMAFPGINYPLVLYRWVRSLGIPIETFAAAQRLGRTLNIDYDFSLEGKAAERLRVLRYPEPRLMALVVIATKLLYPFDDDTYLRTATSTSDPSALAIDWPAWAALHSNEPASKDDYHLSFHDAATLTETDASTLSGSNLDTYLDFYESTFASEDVRSHGEAGKEADFRRALFRLFPADREEGPTFKPDDGKTNWAADTETEGSRLRELQALLQPRPIISNPAPATRMGSAYRRFRSVDELARDSDEDQTAEMQFYSLAAKLAGVGVEEMVQAVFALERRMQTREEEARKQML